MNIIGWVIKAVVGLVGIITLCILAVGVYILIKVTIGLNFPLSISNDIDYNPQNSIEYQSDAEIVKPVIIGESKKSKVSNIYNNPKLPPKKN